MSVAITIRDVPQDVRDELASRAARSGRSMQEYLRELLVERASRPSAADVIARARARVAATGTRIDPAGIIADRDATGDEPGRRRLVRGGCPVARRR